MDFSLLKSLCNVHATSGDEENMTQFLLDYIEKEKVNWKQKPEIIHTDEFQEAIVLVFGKPNTAIFAHIDSIGFTTGYGKSLIRVGGPRTDDGTILVGKDTQGDIECELMVIEDEEGRKHIEYIFDREIDRGTPLTFKMNFREEGDYVQSCYLDNRLGVWSALKVAEQLEDGIIVFSCREEHGAGSVEFLGKYIYEKYSVNQSLILDITWVTEGVKHGKGVAISMRDSGIPRRKYLKRIMELAEKSKVPYQLEVESAGGSDGNALQRSPYPWQWCFIGAPEDYVHSPNEKVHKADIQSMIDMYNYLMVNL